MWRKYAASRGVASATVEIGDKRNAEGPDGSPRMRKLRDYPRRAQTHSLLSPASPAFLATRLLWLLLKLFPQKRVECHCSSSRVDGDVRHRLLIMFVFSHIPLSSHSLIFLRDALSLSLPSGSFSPLLACCTSGRPTDRRPGSLYDGVHVEALDVCRVQSGGFTLARM